MPLFLVRHADAVASDAEIDDAARWLSARGRARALSSARALAAKGMPIDRLVTSPRVRAVQTSELFAQALGFTKEISTLPSLCFSVPAKLAVRALVGLPGSTVAFGHMPTIAEIVQQLTGDRSAPGFDTATVVCIDGGQVRFVIDAE